MKKKLAKIFILCSGTVEKIELENVHKFLNCSLLCSRNSFVTFSKYNLLIIILNLNNKNDMNHMNK